MKIEKAKGKEYKITTKKQLVTHNGIIKPKQVNTRNKKGNRKERKRAKEIIKTKLANHDTNIQPKQV